MNSGITRSVLIFPPRQEMYNILFTVRIIPFIPCVNLMWSSEVGVTSFQISPKVTFLVVFVQVALREIWRKTKGWVRQISRSARQSKRKYSDDFCPVNGSVLKSLDEEHQGWSPIRRKSNFYLLVGGTSRGVNRPWYRVLFSIERIIVLLFYDLAARCAGLSMQE